MVGCRGRLEVEQMLLALSFDDPFSSPAVDPALQAISSSSAAWCVAFSSSYEAAVSSSTRFQLGRLLESCQQEPLALGKIVREERWRHPSRPLL